MLVRVCCCDRGASHDLINSIYSIYLGEISRHGAGGGGASAAAVEAYSSVISKLQAFVRSSQNNSILCGMTAGPRSHSEICKRIGKNNSKRM